MVTHFHSSVPGVTDLVAAGHFQQAHSALLEQLKKNSNDSNALRDIAEISLLQGRKAEALLVLRRQAATLALKGETLAAIGINRRILEIDPADQSSAQALATLTSHDSGISVESFTAAVQTLTAGKFEHAHAEGKDVFGAIDDLISQELARLSDRTKTQTLIDQLPRVPLLSTLARDHLEHLIHKLRLKVFEADEAVVAERDEGNELFIIVDGEAEVFKWDAQGDAKFIARLKRGDFFGEIAFFSDSRRSASVVASTRLTTLIIERGDLAILVTHFPEVAHKMQAYYKSRLIGTVLSLSALFEQLPAVEHSRLVNAFELTAMPFGTAIIREGEHPDGLFLIGTGQVAVYARDANGQDVFINRLGPGDFLGEISLLSGRPATATCVVSKQATIFKLPRAAFDSLAKRFPKTMEVAVETGAARLRRSQNALDVHDVLVQRGMI